MLTTIDTTSALILVDLQVGVVGALPAPVWERVVERSAVLAKAFRSRGLPVVVVTADGFAPGRTARDMRFIVPPGFADPIADIEPQASDVFVVKRTWGAFTGSDLETTLRTAGVTQVVVVGVSTSAGVESTARQAHELGFNVTLAVDAIADPTEASHDHSVSRIFPKLGEIGSTDEIVALLGDGKATSRQ